jgi:Na+/melibiose symporter-like transporter
MKLLRAHTIQETSLSNTATGESLSENSPESPQDQTDSGAKAIEREKMSADSGVMSSRRKSAAFAMMCLSVFIAVLSTFIMTTALPIITHSFGASDSNFAWIGSSYLLSYAAGIPIWARCSDIFGRRAILGLTSIIFIVGSMVGATSHTIAIMIVGRTLQGLGCGGLMIVVNICVVDMYTPRYVRGCLELVLYHTDLYSANAHSTLD